MSKKIPENIIEILSQATIDKGDNSLTLHGQLDRKDYVKVNEVLQSIRGEWDKTAKVHFFPFDPTGPLKEVLEKKELEPKNATAYFPTPSSAVSLMYEMIDNVRFEYADAQSPLKVLEPSGGIGGIADYLRTQTEHMLLDIVEIHPPNQQILQSKGYSPHCMDFMDFEIPDDNQYDFVFMNPPFSLKGDRHAYITHINHALKMLKYSGELVAIVPTGWIKNESKKEEAFRNLVASKGCHIETLEAGTFKESGTMIETKVITFTKNEWKDKPFNGYSSHYIWEFMLYATQEQEFQKRYETLITDENSTNEDFRDFVSYVIKSYAQRDVFLSTEYMDDYIKELKKETKQGQIEQSREWVLEKQKILRSIKFIVCTDVSYVNPKVKYMINPYTIALYKEELEISGLPDIVSAPVPNKVALEDQSKILQSGGDLFDLMSA